MNPEPPKQYDEVDPEEIIQKLKEILDYFSRRKQNEEKLSPMS